MREKILKYQNKPDILELSSINKADVICKEDCFEIPNGYQRIGCNVGFKFYNIKKIIVPESIQEISRAEFRGGYALEEMIFAQNSKLKLVKSKTFLNNLNLKKIIFGDNLEEIEKEAFAGCSKLSEIRIPDGIKKIGSYAFEGTGFKSITFLDNEDGAFMIPTSLETIECGTFANMKNLENVILPENIIEIKEKAFAGCKNLKNLFINSKTKVEKKAIPETVNIITYESEDEPFHNAENLSWKEFSIILLKNQIKKIDAQIKQLNKEKKEKKAQIDSLNQDGVGKKIKKLYDSKFM